MEQKDYYRILGIDRNAPSKEIREVYRRLAFQYHPDKNTGDPAAVERMKEINEAYAVLSDPKKKSDYDALEQEFGAFAYDRFRQNYTEGDIFKDSDLNQIFEEMARSFGFRSFDEVFRESYGQAYRTFEFRRLGVWGRGFIFSGPIHRGGQRRVYRPEIPAPFGIPATNLRRLSRYLLKKMLGIEEAQKGKDWNDVITLDPQQVQEGEDQIFPSTEIEGTGDHNSSRNASGAEDQIERDGRQGKGGREPGDLYIELKVRKSLFRKIRELVGI